MNKHDLPISISSLAAVLLLSFFWPGPYRHEELGIGSGRSVLVRVNRFSGGTEVLLPHRGWEERHPGATPDAPLVVFAAGGGLLFTFFAGFFLGRRATPLT